jgi:hypothetical protein
MSLETSDEPEVILLELSLAIERRMDHMGAAHDDEIQAALADGDEQSLADALGLPIEDTRTLTTRASS